MWEKERNMRIFKNDKERAAFLDDYRDAEAGWKLWKDDPETGIRWWRFDLPAGVLIVEERECELVYPITHRDYIVRQRYIIQDEEKPFGSQQASRTQQIAWLKEMEKKK